MYIPFDRRQALDPLIQHLTQRISGKDELCYALVMVAVMEVRSPTLPELTGILGCINTVAVEFQRRVIQPILDDAARQHGDMFLPKEPSRPALKSV